MVTRVLFSFQASAWQVHVQVQFRSFPDFTYCGNCRRTILPIQIFLDQYLTAIWCQTRVLHTSGSNTALAVAVLSRLQGDLVGSTPWRVALASFGTPHPLLDWATPYSKNLDAHHLSENTRLECIAIYALKQHIRSICVVGNGPLSAKQRQLIDACDIVLRFNQLNTRLCQERLDIWILRHAAHAPMRFHGLNKTKSCTVEEAREAAHAIWFVDGAYADRHADVQDALSHLPELSQIMWMPLDTRNLQDGFARMVDSAAMPSTGWIGMMLALHRTLNTLLQSDSNS
ncbi:hypothetical protein WJX73_006276 [Symbiochloris irregularis]|uniref:Uncharacterized protein n=1 Tax=Symbiochloris irregularis TaxID=706552 RepID=A0AAW1NPC4_9CHLO